MAIVEERLAVVGAERLNTPSPSNPLTITGSYMARACTKRSTYNREPFLYDRHVRRLRQSAQHFSLDVPFDDASLLQWIGRRWRPRARWWRPTSGCCSREASEN